MVYFAALVWGVLAYVLAKLLLERVESIKGHAETLALIIGILVALFKLGAIG